MIGLGLSFKNSVLDLERKLWPSAYLWLDWIQKKTIFLGFYLDLDWTSLQKFRIRTGFGQSYWKRSAAVFRWKDVSCSFSGLHLALDFTFRNFLGCG